MSVVPQASQTRAPDDRTIIRSTASTRRKARGSIPASTRTVVPFDKAISIRPGGGARISAGATG
jgi:hypothetical protein